MTAKLIPPRVPIVDPRTGIIAREWYLYFANLVSAGGSEFNGEEFALAPSAMAAPDLSARVAELEKAMNDMQQGRAA